MRTAPSTNDIAFRMFVATADQNYILARLAYFNHLRLDFFWLSLHATEKYLKAILLLNGRSAKYSGHNVVKLHSDVKKLHQKLVFGPLVDPKIEHLHWRDSSVENFLARLSESGHASNRYLTYGYTAMLDDLMKVDQLVWSVRRHCRPLREVLEGSEIDHVERLRQHPESWTLGGFLPLEEVIEGNRGEEQKNAFLRFNTPFAPNVHHLVPPGLHITAFKPPLAEYVKLLGELDATTEKKALAAAVLKWALANIYFVEDDRDKIKHALAVYETSPMPS